MTQKIPRKAPMPGNKNVTRIGSGRINLAKPSTKADPPREPVRTDLAKLIEQCLPKRNP